MEESETASTPERERDIERERESHDSSQVMARRVNTRMTAHVGARVGAPLGVLTGALTGTTDGVHVIDLPYAGTAGQTCFENVHLVHPNGACSSVSVCRVVNVQTHPELRDSALAGSLHRLEDGRELALSFVYHDPDARKFALVLPTSLAHTELKEWSRLMSEIAEDTKHPVPSYVRDNTTVIGWLALRMFIHTESPASSAETPELTASELDIGHHELAQREHQLMQRERELLEQENALTHMAEELSARENQLLRRQEQLETARVDVELREQELLDLGRARNEAVRLLAGGNWTPVGVVNEPPADEELAQTPIPVHDSVHEALAGAARALDASSRPPPLPTTRLRSAPPPLPLHPHPEAKHPPPLRREPGHNGHDYPSLMGLGRQESRDVTTESNGVHDLNANVNGVQDVPDDDVNTDVGIGPFHEQQAGEPPPLPQHTAAVEPTEEPEAQPQPEVSEPDHFRTLRAGQMAAKLTDDELWLYAHIDEQRRYAYAQNLDLYVQYVEAERYPVMLISLVSQHEPPGNSPVRCALDGYAQADQQVLEHLSRSYRARVALYIDGTYVETRTVAALREGVAQAIGDRLNQVPQERPRLGGSEAMLRVLHAPPPLSNDDLPFGPARREASTTATVLASVEQLAHWLKPEKVAEATLTYCIPRNVIDATIRRVLRAAVAFGIGLPDELVHRAVEHRAARDVPTMIRAQLAGFRQRVEQGGNDLGATATRRNWERLFSLAAEHHVEVDESTRALVSAPSGRPPTRYGSGRPQGTLRPLRPFEDTSSAELQARLREPVGALPEPDNQRLELIRELCLRGHAGAIDPVIVALNALSATDLPKAMAHVLSFGEAAGDGLIGALHAPDPALRQLAALALGRLKLRRALLPLLKQLETEASDIHPELARALGDFGPAAVRALTRALASGQDSDRLIAAMAHVANHGAAKEVERLENDADASVAHAARRAMARRSRLEWEDLAVREQRSLGEGQATAALSQAFYAELSKVAI